MRTLRAEQESRKEGTRERRRQGDERRKKAEEKRMKTQGAWKKNKTTYLKAFPNRSTATTTEKCIRGKLTTGRSD